MKLATQSALVGPRSVPDRNDFYMGMAHWIAAKSKDPSTQVGAVIVSPDNVPLGWGYNGPPRPMNDELLNWDRPYKYDFIRHAEVNAIDHSNGSVKYSTIYVTARPCTKCMLELVVKGINKVVFFDRKITDKNSSLNDPEKIGTTEEIARSGNVILERFEGNLNWMRDRMCWMQEQGIFEKIS